MYKKKKKKKEKLFLVDEITFALSVLPELCASAPLARPCRALAQPWAGRSWRCSSSLPLPAQPAPGARPFARDCGELEVAPCRLRNVGGIGRSRRVFSALQSLWPIPLQETLTSNRFK